MKTDIAERLEKIGNEILALSAELKADIRQEPNLSHTEYAETAAVE